MSKVIPIVILTKDEPRFLELMIKSIIKRTKYPYKIFVVDNCSKCIEQKQLLKNLQLNNKNINVILNNKNEWVLGFNKAISIVNNMKDIDSRYIVLSDGDIIVPLPKDNICWLEYLKNKMDDNVTIGKIGLSLDIGFLKNKKKFKKTYNIEENYMKAPQINDLIIAPVDTTLAIYRKDLYIKNKFEIIPGHASLVKPYYYIFRTDKSYQAKHLGWKNYTQPNKEQLEDKIICFTKYAAYIDPLILEKVDKKIKYFYKFGRYFYKAYWSLNVVFLWIRYIIKNFPRNMNQIQAKYR